MKHVTYKGPKDPDERSDYVVVDGNRYRKGVPVEVSDQDAAAVKRLDDHEFSVTSDSPSSDSKEVE